jgi:kumamolisin
VPEIPRHTLLHSVPGHPPGAARLGHPPGSEVRTVTLVLAGTHDEALEQQLRAIDEALPLSRAARPAPAELAAARAVPAEAFRAVEHFAAEHGLEVVSRSAVQRHVVLRGTTAQLEAAFGVKLLLYRHGNALYHSHDGPVHLPAELRETVQAVLGLDAAPLARPLAVGIAQRPARGSYSPRAIARRYRFPTGVTGAGQRIAIISFGGGFHQDDLTHYFTRLLRLAAPPRVRAIRVPDQHAPAPTNDPFPLERLSAFIADMNDPSVPMKRIEDEMGCPICLARALATFETTIDIEIAGAIAPGADIDVYFASNTLAGWRAAIHAAAGMRGDDDPAPTTADDSGVLPATVISLSWGCAETQPSGLWKEQVDLAVQQARDRGITVCCASGDLGSLGVDPGAGTGYEGAANVICPASSPSALACGGTTIGTEAETAWNNPTWKASPMASGGGVSGFFARPSWQAASRVPPHASMIGASWLREDADRASWTGRGVPDVAANADAASGYELFVGGRAALGGGTSAAAPLWSGLVALLNEHLSHAGERPITLGFVNALLYRPDLAAALRPIEHGDNRLEGSGPGVAWFEAGPGWNPCTGLGVPDGQRLLEVLSRLE